MLPKKLRILALAPYLDDRDVGEAYCAYRWVKALSEKADVTLLTMGRPTWSDKRRILPGVRVMSLTESHLVRFFPRLNAMAKLSYGAYCRWAKRQIEILLEDGETYDVAHQFSPFALRHSSPLRHFTIPYVLGPKAGSLQTPAPLKSEMGGDPFYMRLRGLDRLRLRWSQSLRSSYQRASLVLGAAPYVGDRLGALVSDRFAVESELGIDTLPLERHKNDKRSFGSQIRLLHVGRGVRSKGLRDVIRALTVINPNLPVHLDVAGQGPEIDHCERLAEKWGVRHRITFHGQVSRQAVEGLYAKADIFAFPSFREPSGSVIYEAMAHGLPIIAADVGGPGHVLSEETAIKITPDEPQAFARAIARALGRLSVDHGLRARMGAASRRYLAAHAIWSVKADRMIARYRHMLMPQAQTQTQTQTLAHIQRETAEETGYDIAQTSS